MIYKECFNNKRLIKKIFAILIEILLNFVNPLECFGEVLDYFEEMLFLDVVNPREVHCLRCQQSLIILEHSNLTKCWLNTNSSQESVALLVKHSHWSNLNVIYTICLIFFDEEVIIFDKDLFLHVVDHLCHHFDSELLPIKERYFG